MKAKKILFWALLVFISGMLVLLGCRGRQVVTRQDYVPYTDKEIHGLIIYQNCTQMCHQCSRPATPRVYTRAQWEKILAELHPSPGRGAQILLGLSAEDREALRAYCLAEARDAPVVQRPQLRLRTKDRRSPPSTP